MHIYYYLHTPRTLFNSAVEGKGRKKEPSKLVIYIHTYLDT